MTAAGGRTKPTKKQTLTARIFQAFLPADPSPIFWVWGTAIDLDDGLGNSPGCTPRNSLSSAKNAI